MIDPAYYFATLYPLQDQLLALVNGLETGFYLTGGTAASRRYLHHRFSDDLAFFVNDQPEFNRWAERVIQAILTTEDRYQWQCQVINKDTYFVRLVVHKGEVSLKIEFINDVPAHIGKIEQHETLGRVDSAENILANKITAVLSREEPKDLADMWGFCCQMGLSLTDALENAHSKAAGVFAPDLARVPLSVTDRDHQAIRWITPPERDQFKADLRQLAERLLTG